MKVTNPPRETVSSLNYRDADETPTETAPELRALAAAALALLEREGTETDGGGNPGDKTWTAVRPVAEGEMTVICTGPDLPTGLPDQTAHPSTIPFERPWTGTYRLVVRAPIIALDLYWRPDAPLRIMTFSRGTWEEALLVMAG